MFYSQIAVSVICVACLAACSAQLSDPDSQTNAQIPTTSKSIAVPAVAPKRPKSINVAAVGTQYNQDVIAFIEKRDACDHFRGEEPYDAERGEILNKAVAQSCAGTDEMLKSLRYSYKDNTDILAKLKKYEDNIEVAP
jgi:hypothetical protein